MSETIKLVVAIPSSGSNPFAFTLSLASMMAYLANGLRTRPDTGLELILDGQCSSCIQSNRELLVSRALKNERTHLLFLDHDMHFEPQVVDILFGRRQPVVATNYLIKRQPPETPEFVAVGLNGRRIITEQRSVGLQEISYSGFGVSLFEMKVFRTTPQPWFEPKFVKEANCYTTEDNPCYERIRAAGFPCYVDHEASKLVSHVGDFEWKWDQYQRPATAAEKKPAEFVAREPKPSANGAPKEMAQV